MKKIFLILFIFIITNIHAFNYGNYKPYTIDTLIEYIETTSDLNLPGLTYYYESIAFPFTVKSYPDTKNDEKYKNEIDFFTKTYNIPNGVIGNVYIIEKDSYQIILVFQNKLVPYLKNDADIGDKIGMYCMMGYFNDFGKKIVCLVSAFNTEDDYKQRGTIPIWE